MAGNDRESGAAPVQVRGTVLTVRRVDAYVAMTVVAPAIATRFRPGQFIAIAVGGQQSGMLARRTFPRPRDPASCLLLGVGAGAPPLFALAARLTERQSATDFLLGAESADRVF